MKPACDVAVRSHPTEACPHLRGVGRLPVKDWATTNAMGIGQHAPKGRSGRYCGGRTPRAGLRASVCDGMLCSRSSCWRVTEYPYPDIPVAASNGTTASPRLKASFSAA